MRTEEFKKVVKEKRYWLDWFFHSKLTDARRLENLQSTKQELIQDTIIQTWVRLQRESSATYKVKTLLQFEAENVWVQFIKPRRKALDIEYKDNFESDSSSFEIVDQIESIDILQQLAKHPDQVVWSMLIHRAEGYTFEDISAFLKIPRTTIMDKIKKARQSLSEKYFPKPPGSSEKNS